MKWQVAQAKQQLSEVLRKAEDEPQLIYRRDRPVAAVLGLGDLAEFERWREARSRRTLADRFAELRQILEEEGYVLELPERRDRPNAFADAVSD
jgi:prevent-host-death family protein